MHYTPQSQECIVAHWLLSEPYVWQAHRKLKKSPGRQHVIWNTAAKAIFVAGMKRIFHISMQRFQSVPFFASITLDCLCPSIDISLHCRSCYKKWQGMQTTTRAMFQVNCGSTDRGLIASNGGGSTVAPLCDSFEYRFPPIRQSFII
jgi:hypothetical protein